MKWAPFRPDCSDLSFPPLLSHPPSATPRHSSSTAASPRIPLLLHPVLWSLRELITSLDWGKMGGIEPRAVFAYGGTHPAFVLALHQTWMSTKPRFPLSWILKELFFLVCIFFFLLFFSSSSPGILRREMEDLHYRGHYTSLMVHSLPGCHLTPYKIIIKACPREPGQTAIPPRQNIDSIWMWTSKAAKKRQFANCWKEGKDTPCFQRGVQLVLDLW